MNGDIEVEGDLREVVRVGELLEQQEHSKKSLFTTIMLNILLMVIIGGMGTMYGAIVGAAFLQFAEAWLPDLQKLTAAILPDVEIVQRLSERWILYFGILFVLMVYFFPKGFVGTAREAIRARRERRGEEHV